MDIARTSMEVDALQTIGMPPTTKRKTASRGLTDETRGKGVVASQDIFGPTCLDQLKRGFVLERGQRLVEEPGDGQLCLTGYLPGIIQDTHRIAQESLHL